MPVGIIQLLLPTDMPVFIFFLKMLPFIINIDTTTAAWQKSYCTILIISFKNYFLKIATLNINKMRIFSFILLLLITALSQAQNDYPDYRNKKDIFTRIIEKDIRSDIASFSMGGIEESIGKLPLKTLPITGTGTDFISFAGNNIEVSIRSKPFEPAKHKLGYFENKYLVKINNKAYFGDYGKVPKTAIANITVIIDRDTVAIPEAAYSDLYNPVFSFSERGVQKSRSKVFLSADGRKIYIYMLKPEEGGSYEVTWVIQDKKYLRRVVDYGLLK
jgi:hypothetical protein